MQINKMSGAGLTEAIAVSFAMVPMFMMIVTLGKVADFNHTSTQAVRFAAWEEAMLGSNAAVHASERKKISNWILSSDQKVISSQITSESIATRNNLWDLHYRLGPNGSGQLIDTTDNEAINITSTRYGLPSTDANRVMEGVGKQVKLIERITRDKVGLSWDGMQRTNLQLAINGAGLVGDKGCSEPGVVLQKSIAIEQVQSSGQSSICVSRKSAILVDTWAAADPTQVADRSRALVPTLWLKPYRAVLDTLSAYRIPVPLPGVSPLQLYKEAAQYGKSVGFVDSDEIPPDRLGDPNE